MDINVKEMKRVTLIELNGRVDSSTAPQLGDTLDKQLSSGSSNIVIDMQGVEYMSSAGLREMVAALKRAKSNSGDLRLCSLNERVTEVLELAGLDSIFDVYEDQVAAVGSY